MKEKTHATRRNARNLEITRARLEFATMANGTGTLEDEPLK